MVSTIACGGSQPDATNQVSRPGGSDNPIAATDSRVTITQDAALDRVYNERQNDSFTPDFAIGPGDVLSISSPDVDELKDRTERVSGQGNIDLPLAGDVHIGGLTEAQARDAIKKALSRLVKDPQVDVFVREYVSRLVAVIGVVNKPGLYSMTSRSNTILDMISQAGGMNAGSSNFVIFIPAPPGSGAEYAHNLMLAMGNSSEPKTKPAVGERSVVPANAESATASEGPQAPIVGKTAMTNGALLPPVLSEQHPIYISLNNLMRGSKDDVPVRPGDVIIVPASGSVMVQGWVGTPGAYAITPGMTVLAAITAAGGQQFSQTARVLRAQPDGERMDIPVDLSKIEKGEERDVPVEAGDVIIVNKSAAGAVPYAVYMIWNKLGAGLAMPIP